jgi:predicted PurR-regulated permease PerM
MITNMPHRIEISYKTIVFTVLFILSLWIVYQVRDVIFLFITSFVVMAGMRPGVNLLMRIRIPRIIAIFIVYLLFFAVIGASIFLVIPPLVAQFKILFEQLNSYVSFILPFVDLSPERITDQIPLLSQNVLKITTGLFSTLFGIFSFFVFTFYLLLERGHIRQFMKNFVGETAEKDIVFLLRKVENRLSAWVTGQLALMVIIGVATYIGLTLLDVELALSLAIIAGLLEIVPIIGPIISAVPAVIIALATSPILAVATVALYFIIQQIENNVIVPLVMRRATGLPPLVTIVALMVGGKLAGIMGIVLSVPALVIAQVLFKELLFRYDKKPGRGSV